MVVLDSSAAADLLIPHRPQATWVEAQLDADGWDLHAPFVLDVEVARVIRRFLLRGELSEEAAATAVELLAGLPLARYAHVPLLERAWELRHVADVADACFIALAEIADAPLVTTDEHLARIAGLHIEVRAFER